MALRSPGEQLGQEERWRRRQGGECQNRPFCQGPASRRWQDTCPHLRADIPVDGDVHLCRCGTGMLSCRRWGRTPALAWCLVSGVSSVPWENKFPGLGRHPRVPDPQPARPLPSTPASSRLIPVARQLCHELRGLLSGHLLALLSPWVPQVSVPLVSAALWCRLASVLNCQFAGMPGLGASQSLPGQGPQGAVQGNLYQAVLPLQANKLACPLWAQGSHVPPSLSPPSTVRHTTLHLKSSQKSLSFWKFASGVEGP